MRLHRREEIHSLESHPEFPVLWSDVWASDLPVLTITVNPLKKCVSAVSASLFSHTFSEPRGYSCSPSGEPRGYRGSPGDCARQLIGT